MICSVAFAGLAMAQSASGLVPATFDDLDLPAESWWVGDVDDPDYSTGTFRSGSFEFNNYYVADWGSWGFFGYANETGNVFPGGYAVKDQMLNCVGGGYNSKNYGMGFIASYMGSTTITMPDFQTTGVNVNGMWITNSAWVVSAILNGDGMSDAFGQGDYLKVIFKGYDKDDNETQTEFYLADYRSEDTTEHYYVDSWRYCDLSTLGNVVRIDVDMVSTKANDYGITTPCYFAFDDLGVINGGSGAESVKAMPEVRISVINGVATVAADTDEFMLEAISADGVRVATETSAGVANIELPAVGVNILRVVTPTGIRVLKVMNK